MLPLLLMLISDPLVTGPPTPPPLPPVHLNALDATRGAGVECRTGGFQTIERPSAQSGELTNNLVFRPEHEVRRYMLIERSVRGCPAPISYSVPYRPAVQPPRSSE